MSDNKIDLNDIVTAPEAAELVGIKVQAVKQAISRGLIESRKSGRSHLLRRVDVMRVWKHRTKP